MNDWITTAARQEWPLALGVALVLSAVLARTLPNGRATVRHSLLFLAFWLGVDALAALVAAHPQPVIARAMHQTALFGYGVALIRLAGLGLFRAVLPRLGMQPPRILEDIVVVVGYLAWGMVRLSYAGVELSSLVTTSAVLTAVIAFSMQDTLGNVLGGLALQLDDSLEIGDWVRLDDVSGRVVEIHWRFTALLTRNGEKVVIPNAQLMKGKFTVIGREGWRRWVWFQIEDRVAPSLVVSVAEEAVADAEIGNVLHAPPPSCVAMEFKAGAVRYALRYWLLDPRDDDATDSAVRTHLLAAVRRHRWRMAIDDQSVQLYQDHAGRHAEARREELAQRLAALAGVELFASLDDDERRHIAERLVPAPFVRGDVITRQGAAAHWLYILVAGEAEVYWEPPSGERRLLTRLAPGHLFGEMGLLTGAPRSATVIAATDVTCYRLDKAGFEDIIHARRDLAETLSHILAQRLQHNDELRDAFQRQQDDGEHAERRAAILQRIRDFFALA